MSFESTYLEGIKVAERLGTWVFYAARDASSHDHLIGYMLYTVDDLTRLRKRSESENRRQLYARLIGDWRRAIRWVQALHPETRVDLVGSIIQRAAEHPTYANIPYCTVENGHRSLMSQDQPQRRAGRPRVRDVSPQRGITCEACAGLGYVPAT